MILYNALSTDRQKQFDALVVSLIFRGKKTAEAVVIANKAICKQIFATVD